MHAFVAEIQDYDYLAVHGHIPKHNFCTESLRNSGKNLYILRFVIKARTGPIFKN